MEGYPLEVPVEVRFCDIDAFGHVNNAVFVTYLEQARVALYRELLKVTSATGFDFILARVEVDFLKPIRLHDPLRVGLRVESLGQTSYVLAYQLMVGEQVVARARSVQVFFDYQRNTKKPVPDEFRRLVEPLLP